MRQSCCAFQWRGATSTPNCCGTAPCEYWYLCTRVVCCATQREKHDTCEQSKTIITHFARKTKTKLTLRTKCQSTTSLRREFKFSNCQAGPGLEWFCTRRAFTEYCVSIVDKSHQVASRELVNTDSGEVSVCRTGPFRVTSRLFQKPRSGSSASG